MNPGEIRARIKTIITLSNKKQTIERICKKTMLEMTDCRHFRYNEIDKGLGTDSTDIVQVAYCLIGMGGIDGCPKYCPLYETK
jgi:hypothetical protein